MEIIGSLLIIYVLYILPLIIYIATIKFKNKNILKKCIIILSYISAYIILPDMYTNIIPTIIIILLIIYWKNNDINGEYKKYKFSLREFKFSKALKYVIVLYIILIIVSNLNNIILTNLGIDLEGQEIVTILSSYDLSAYLLTIPFTIIFAPISEEFTFRYLIFNRLFESILNSRIAFIILATLVSIIFASVHFSITVFAALFTLSFYNCYIIEKKGFWYAVFNHLVINGVTAIVLLSENIILLLHNFLLENYAVFLSQIFFKVIYYSIKLMKKKIKNIRI